MVMVTVVVVKQLTKQTKALLVIIPLLGITYIITILGPSDASTTSHILFVHLRAVLLSTQVID